MTLSIIFNDFFFNKAIDNRSIGVEGFSVSEQGNIRKRRPHQVHRLLASLKICAILTVRIIAVLNIFTSVQFVGKTPAASKVLPIAGGTQVFSKRGHCILLKDKIDIIQLGNIDWFSDYRILSIVLLKREHNYKSFNRS